MTDNFTFITRYWRDPAPFVAEQEANRATCHAAIDQGMSALNRKQALRWAKENEHADRT